MLWTLTHILLIAAIVSGALSLWFLLGLLTAAAMSCRSGEDAGPYLDATAPVSPNSHNSHPSHSPPAAPSLRRECSWCKTVLSPGSPGAITTSTICPQCQSHYFPQSDQLTHLL